MKTDCQTKNRNSGGTIASQDDDMYIGFIK